MEKGRFSWETHGKACEKNIVRGTNYRFTVLTSCMIRMEYDETGTFEDRASQKFFHRNFDESKYQTKLENGILTIETENLLLTYKENAEFKSGALSIQLKHALGALWHFGETADQLKGTASTLDLAYGPIPLEDGVCSRDGYTIIDDSDSLLLTEEGWFDLRREGTQDVYFFGYGHDYLGCIQDFYRITGRPPLLPDYALGNWWSRYYDYTQEEYCNLMERFEKEDIPFSVAVVDMGWHTQEKDIEENRIPDSRYNPGWTGYTWNKKLFPDYREFLRFLKKHNLKTALNLHPAQGIGCHEIMYQDMAKACGIDPESRKLIKFDCLNPDFMEKYFDVLHHPYEEEGVDFWWMDWQQGTDYWWVHDEEHPEHPLEKMNPLWLLNHLHITDISRNGKRPMFFSRYSGIGSHRYPVGFSGDTVVTWEALDFQPYFTANASNVGYSWWSHDIGGHRDGFRDDEMVVRWMQLGVLSPINRLHSTFNLFAGKEPWNLHPYMAQIATKWLQMRHELFPYIYTMNYRNHMDLIPLILPMYYTHPESEGAYRCRNQYWFGSEFFVSPITEKADPCSLLGKTNVWFPKGEWIDAFHGFVYRGEQNAEVFRGIEEFPVFAKAGAIIPIQKHTGNNKLGRQKDMELYVFAGADNAFTLYEDEGDYDNYKEGVFVQTKFEVTWTADKAEICLHGASGQVSLLPEKRNWNIKLRGVKQAENVKIYVDGRQQAVLAEYDKTHATMQVQLPEVAVTSEVKLVFHAENGLLNDNSATRERIYDILLHAQMSYAAKNNIWNYLQQPVHDRPFVWCCEPQHQVLMRALQEMLKLEEKSCL